MTTINNNDFKVIEKKAPAKKAPRDTKVDMTDGERDLLNAITTLQRNADAQKQLISSVNDKNDTLQEKLEIFDVDCVKVVIPNHTLKNAINKQIEKVNNKLMNSIDEANDVIEQLTGEDVQKSLKDMGRVNDLEKTIERLDDNMYRLDDLDYDIENAVRSELDYCDYIKEDDVNDMVESAINDGEYITREDIDNDLKIYGREINELRERLNNTIYNKVCRLVKSIFSYNLSNKVRSVFKRNNNKKIDINEIDVNKGMDLNEIADRIKASKK